MRKRVLLGVLAGVSFAVAGLLGVVNAQEFRHGNTATVAENEKIDSSAYLAGRNVDIAGSIDGDLFCAGQNVTFSGNLSGDLICAGQTVTITGNVEGDVRVAAQTLVIGSTINGNLTVAAQSFTLNSGAKIGGDITGGTDNAVLNGEVGRDVVFGASEITINGTVGRNIKSGVDHLRLGNTAKVGGDVEYTSVNQVYRASGAEVSGQLLRHEPEAKHREGNWFSSWAWRLYWFFALLLVSLALVLLFPSVFHDAAEKTITSPGKTLLTGVLTTLLAPALLIVLMVTVVGIPLALLLMLIWFMVLILSGPFFGYLIGRLVWKAQRNPILTMLAGSAILLLVYNIPFINILAMLVVVFGGSGMFLREAMRRSPKPKYKN